jgi:hypothetical protein
MHTLLSMVGSILYARLGFGVGVGYSCWHISSSLRYAASGCSFDCAPGLSAGFLALRFRRFLSRHLAAVLWLQGRSAWPYIARLLASPSPACQVYLGPLC